MDRLSKGSAGQARWSRGALAVLILQASNWIIPILAAPLLAHALGPSNYGIVVYGLSIVAISGIVTDFGFGISAVYDVAEGRDCSARLNQLLGTILMAKGVLIVASLSALSLYLLVDDKYQGFHDYLWMSSLAIIGQALVPTWFFIGLGRMIALAAGILVARAVYLIWIALLVHRPQDYLWVAIGNGISWLLAATITLTMVVKRGHRIQVPKGRAVLSQLKRSSGFFWSRAAYATYAVGGTAFLGLTSTPSQVAYYGAAQQLYNGGQSIMAPVNQLLYPYMVRERDFETLFRVLRLVIALAVIGLAFGLLLGAPLIGVIFGPGFGGSFPVLIVFLIAFLFVAPANVLGYPFLGALGRPEKANLSVLIGGGVQLVVLTGFYLAGWTRASQVVISVLLVEVVVFSMRAVTARQLYASRNHR